ncbi:hypothetical protein EAG_07088 [Camponotus floridanus]|uniref:Uncharacterized protein n=1 Tax=Camponotus floridanus TaxID=104421 RepID=E2AJR0_CAMFO|nr:hypothetical protein EAG_07088 [Camponotus floridanus]
MRLEANGYERKRERNEAGVGFRAWASIRGPAIPMWEKCVPCDVDEEENLPRVPGIDLTSQSESSFERPTVFMRHQSTLTICQSYDKFQTNIERCKIWIAIADPVYLPPLSSADAWSRKRLRSPALLVSRGHGVPIRLHVLCRGGGWSPSHTKCPSYEECCVPRSLHDDPLLTVVIFGGIYKLTYKRFGVLIIDGINYVTCPARFIATSACNELNAMRLWSNLPQMDAGPGLRWAPQVYKDFHLDMFFDVSIAAYNKIDRLSGLCTTGTNGCVTRIGCIIFVLNYLLG